MTKLNRMKTIKESIDSMKQDGFTEDFMVTEDNHLKCYCSDKAYSPEDVSIRNFHRFEGVSDPADMSILYAIETNDGIRGTLTDAYGTYSDDKVSAFIKEVEEIEKKRSSENSYLKSEEHPEA
jgi:hypothetical protein